MMLPRYHINIFWYAPDGCWVADVPDLKSCSAFGDTPAEALSEAEVAIRGWVDAAIEAGIAVPEARYRPAIYGSRAAA